jgi:hypothetical protein
LRTRLWPKFPVNREKYREISEFLVPDFEYVPSINNISGNLGRYLRGIGPQPNREFSGRIRKACGS